MPAILTRGLGVSPYHLVIRGFGAGTVPPTSATSLIDSIAAWWLTVSTLTTSFPGGLHYDTAQKTPTTAYATFKAKARLIRVTTDTRIFNTTVEFTVYAGTDSAVEDCLIAIRDAITPAGDEGHSWEWARGFSTTAVQQDDELRKSRFLRPQQTGLFYECVRYQMYEHRSKA